jgi:hypothetical protein
MVTTPVPIVLGPRIRPVRLKGPPPLSVSVGVFDAAKPNQSVLSPIRWEVPAESKTAELLLVTLIVKPASVYGKPGLMFTTPPEGARFSNVRVSALAEAAGNRIAKIKPMVNIRTVCVIAIFLIIISPPRRMI